MLEVCRCKDNKSKLSSNCPPMHNLFSKLLNKFEMLVVGAS